ncbi:Zn(II)2Cys6 transcription factor [Pseudozyma hubeiensis]|nr:Zn(II)2Cys6 transcription factor [Pseudozyma hubeiensis]
MSVSSSASSSNSTGRTLRRRRSAASAALLAKPSTLTLDQFVPSFETCVLIYIIASTTSTELVYALFEPHFLIHGSTRSIQKLDRSSWERLRSHVEELRIVALSSGFDEPIRSPTTPPNSPIKRRKPDCMFDLSIPTDTQPSSTNVMRIYLQPRSYTTVPARDKEDLLEIEIHAPEDEALAKQRRVCLPAQIRAVLQDAEQLMLGDDADRRTPMSAPADGQHSADEAVGNVEFAKTCDRILDLVLANSAL